MLASSTAATPPAARPTARAAASAAVAGLVRAVDAVVDQVPADLPEAQALTDCAELLVQVERLRAGLLGRIADVDARRLYVLDEAPSVGAWVAQQSTSVDRGEVALARRLGSFPTLDEAVREGRLPVVTAERVAKALARLRRHVDRPDGRIDGQDGEQALVGVLGHGIRLVLCEALGGLADDDPRLDTIVTTLAELVEAPLSQLDRLERGFVLLAEQLEPPQLPDALGRLVDALLPNELERQAERGHDERGFTLTPKGDGSGFVPSGDLDVETGELLLAVLAAEMRVDGDNPSDTAAYGALREQGWQPGDELPLDGPRSLRQRRHDALRAALRRYLDSGVAGLRDKVRPHVSVVVGVDLLDGLPGALPAVSTVSRRRLPASLVRRWWCDSAVTRFVVGLGHRVLEASHTDRTLKPHERRAKWIETGGRCEVAGCRCGPDQPVVPHHVDAWARTGRTSLRGTAGLCDLHHHDLHVGRKVLRLRDGRRLSEDGWVTGPTVF